MEDIDFLPIELKSRSLSQSEVVLNYNDVLKAIDIFVQGDWAIVGWEGWIRYPNGTYGHTPQVLGTEALFQEDDESWKSYVERTSNFCRRTIIQEQQTWSENPLVAGTELYFCITVERNGELKENMDFADGDR